MLFEMLTGRTPWDCRSEKELIEKISKIPVEVPINFPDDVKEFIRGCLQPDESKRFGLQEFINCNFIAKLLKSRFSLK